MQGDFDSKILT